MKDLEKLDKALNECKDAVYKLNDVASELALKETRIFTDRIRKIVHSKKPSEIEKRKINWIIAIILGIILFGGLIMINKSGLMDYSGLYLFGFIFFTAGVCVGTLALERGTLVFLFSHGLTGACIMMYALLHNVFSSPILMDLSTNSKIYLLVTVAVFVSAFIYIIRYRVTSKLLPKYSKIIPFVLFAIAFGMAGYFNYICSL